MMEIWAMRIVCFSFPSEACTRSYHLAFRVCRPLMAGTFSFLACSRYNSLLFHHPCRLGLQVQNCLCSVHHEHDSR